MVSELAQRLLAWFDQNARALPWRESPPHPYRVWVSEVMLQQTQVETVLPYYQRWMTRFPDLETLAAATEQEVLRLWEGLGYYQRARALHRAAQILVRERGGCFPQRATEWQTLPGIGPYTAAAIASIAFGEVVLALDGNVRRVLARLFDLDLPVDSPAGERELRRIGQVHVPIDRPGDFNQALMDLGATLCRPQTPQCEVCPVAGLCLARARGTQSLRPVRRRGGAVPHYIVTAAVIWRGEQVLLAQRPPQGLLGGLWEFPGGKQEPGESLEEALQREIREELGTTIGVGEKVGVFRHAYSHFRVTLHAFHCCLVGGEPQPLEATALEWVPVTRLTHYPMGKLDRQIAQTLMQARPSASAG